MSGIRVDVQGCVGYLTLVQPRTLNALSAAMLNELKAGLRSHEKNPRVSIIVVKSDHDRAFCAGGEMKQLRDFALRQNTDAISSFFRDEYALNLAIAECTKPYLAIIDGIAMGGGLGISVHGRYRVVTERAILAMPESRIGFFPDVGGSYFLPRLPRRCGYWLGLTAASVKGHQAVLTGLATHFVKQSEVPTLLKSLEGLPQQTLPAEYSAQQQTRSSGSSSSALESSIAQCLNNVASVEYDETFQSRLENREHWFSETTLHGIEQRLQEAAKDDPDAAHLLELLQSASPYSAAITMALFERTVGLSLQQCLEAEHTLAIDACAHPDFVEGIRAVLVDKDRQPNWRR